MKDQEDRGRKIVLGIIGITVGFSALVIITSILLVGPQGFLLPVARFTFTILLGFFLYRGSKWAYWVLVILYGLGGVSGIMNGFMLLAKTPLGLVSLAMGVVYLLSAWILVYSDHVKAFLARQRRSGEKLS